MFILSFALIMSVFGMYFGDTVSHVGNIITDIFRNPILVEAYKSNQSDLEIVQEGLKDTEIDFYAFTPESILKYSFGTKIKEVDEDGSSSNGNSNSFDTNKLRNSGNLIEYGSYETTSTATSSGDEAIYEMFLLKNGGAGPLACIVGMMEIGAMCLFAVMRFLVLMLLIALINIAVVYDSFTGDNQTIYLYLKFLVKTVGISFVFNLAWIAASTISHYDELAIIHPQYWSIAIYGLVIGITYLFWWKQMITEIIKPAINKVTNASSGIKSKTEGVRAIAGKINARFGGEGSDLSTSGLKLTSGYSQNTATSSVSNSSNRYLEHVASPQLKIGTSSFFKDSGHKSDDYVHLDENNIKMRFSHDLGQYVRDE